MIDFQSPSHFNYFLKLFNGLSSQYEHLEANHITLIHFILSGLTLTQNPSSQLPWQNDPTDLINFIYSFQSPHGGFTASPSMNSLNSPLCSNIAMTYSAICCLLLLGDDLTRINTSSMINFLENILNSNGTVSCAIGCEADMRFIYCFSFVLNQLNLTNSFPINSIVNYILSCQNSDGGFGSVLNSESHAGSTFCAIGALKLLNKLSLLPNKNKKRTIIFLRLLQNKGFHGRINKKDDSCYVYWTSCSLFLLNNNSLELLDIEKVEEFISECVTVFNYNLAAVAKTPEDFPDPMHACLGLFGLALCRGNFNPNPNPNPIYENKWIHALLC
ncbi:hypothetical protein RCL1_008274 [Eukaryota sp. TZLM3-RCL]